MSLTPAASIVSSQFSREIVPLGFMGFKAYKSGKMDFD